MSLELHAFDGILLRAVLEGALAVGIIALLLRVFPRTPSSWAAFLWWMACGKFVLALLPYSQAPWALPVSIDLPAAPSSMVDPETREGMLAILREESRDALAAAMDAANVSPRETATRADFVRILKSGLLALWIGGALLCFARGARAVFRSQRALAMDSTEPDPADRALLAQLAARMGLRTIPRLRLSSSAPAPHLLSVGAPTIVLPSALWVGLDRERRELILAHELVHVRRRDALWSWMPWLVECVFWFHPFAKIAAAEFAIARESACDEEVLRRLDASPRRYGELLLSLGAAPKMSWAGIGVAPGFRSLRRRISMLDRAISFDRRRSIGVLALALLATFLPVRFEKGADAMTADNMCNGSNSSTSSSWSTSVSSSDGSSSVTISTDDSGGDESTSYYWDDGSNDDKSIYLFDGDDVRVMGSFNDAEHDRVIELKKSGKVQIVERDGSTVYVIDDPKVLKEARELFKALEPLEKKQQELGFKQSQLGVKQSKLGTKQSELGLQMAKLGEQMAELQVELQERIQKDLETSDLEARIEAIGTEMGRLGQQQGALGDQQSQIGDQQSKLGDRQSEIGEQQSQLSQEIREELEKLIGKAKNEGLAREI